MGKLVLLSESTPKTRWALKIHESESAMSTIVQSETLARVEGVRVRSICPTRRKSTRSWERVAYPASEVSVLFITDGELTVDGAAHEVVKGHASPPVQPGHEAALVADDHAAKPHALPVLWRFLQTE